MKNKYQIKENVIEIYVNSPEYGFKTILIDIEDSNLVFQYNWCINKIKNSFYCVSTKRPLIKLHRLIMEFPKNRVIDHKNHDTQDNRKSNLRICTKRQNERNSIKPKNNTSGFKGVYLYIDKRNKIECKYWRSAIRFNNKFISLGCFPNTEEGKVRAAIRYDQEAVKLFGEFALLNFQNKKLLK